MKKILMEELPKDLPEANLFALSNFLKVFIQNS